MINFFQRKTAKKVSAAGITESGPVLIEGNTAPAADLLQIPFYVQEHKGVRHLIETYLS